VRVDVAREPPLDAVLELLRRMRLRELMREEELEEAAVVAPPVVAVALRPALVGVELFVERKLEVVLVRGYVAASMSADPPPWQRPPRSAVSVPDASSTARPSSTNSQRE
jgi:hypothetical protein